MFVLSYTSYQRHAICLAKSNLAVASRGRKSRRGEERVKYKWRGHRKRLEPQEIAKDYYDEHYPRYLGREWPSIRCAMLSRKKYCSVLNNFMNTASYEEKLLESGAYNFIAKFNANARQKWLELDQQCNVLYDHSRDSSSCKIQMQLRRDTLNLDNSSETYRDDVLQQFENLQKEMDFYEEATQMCHSVRAYIYPKEDLIEFKSIVTRVGSHHMYQNFILDAASVLPILALDPHPNDHVLDMCASPGGKLNVILQHVGLEGKVVANDVSKQRLKQTRTVLSQYIPSENDITNTVKLTSQDGKIWGDIEQECYDKVLVDVPCTNDRLSIYEPEKVSDHMFYRLRKNERARLPEEQSELLKNAVLACNVDGTVVYSTCSASRWQNEFVVQYALQELEEKNVRCEVIDLSRYEDLLSDEFYFNSAPPVGTLVQPKLDANFGPMYICKLRRLR